MALKHKITTCQPQVADECRIFAAFLLLDLAPVDPAAAGTTEC